MPKNVFYHSHDYPDDTKMTVSIREDKATQLTLSFTSEDSDMGTEEMIYAGHDDYLTLAEDLLDDLSSYLDSIEFFKTKRGWVREDHYYYGEYSRTALYAFEELLKEVTEK